MENTFPEGCAWGIGVQAHLVSLRSSQEPPATPTCVLTNGLNLSKLISSQFYFSSRKSTWSESALQDSKNPPFNLGLLALIRWKLRMEEQFEARVRAGPSHPF